MEIALSSPASNEEDQSPKVVSLPGLDNQDTPRSSSPEAVSNGSPSSSPESPEQNSNSNEIGPATPSGEQSRDGSESLSPSNGAEPNSQDGSENQQWLRRTPSISDEVGEESVIREEEVETNDQCGDTASSPMEAPPNQDEEAVNQELPDPSSPFPSSALPGLDYSAESPTPDDYVPGLGSPNKAPLESNSMYAFLATAQDDDEEEENEDIADKEDEMESKEEGDEEKVDEEKKEEEGRVETDEEEKKEQEEMQKDREEGEEMEFSVQESIPFLGGDTIPSPGEEIEEMEEGTNEVESEKASEIEEAEGEPQAKSVMETQILSEEADEAVSHVESSVVNEVQLETQMDVVEQVVETSEIGEASGSEIITSTEVVAPVVSEEKDGDKAEETVETVSEEKETVKEEEAARSPQQIVEEVFLTTDGAAKDQESGEESDFDGFEASEATPKPSRKRRARVIDDDDEDEGEESDFDGFEPEENKKGDRQGLIADIFDIFGHSDDEGEFDGFAETEVPPAGQEGAPEDSIADADKDATEEDEGEESGKKKKKKKKEGDESSSSSEDEGVTDQQPIVRESDFEIMMMKKKEENRRRHRRRGDNIDTVNINDDLVVALISDMKMAASIDRDLVMQKIPAIQKLRMLPQVVGMLRKSDFQMALIDCGVLSAITEWLSPLPDRSLPALAIRRSLLQALTELPGIGSDSLKESGVGKAVMYLNKHPKEVSENRKIAGKLIYNWSRPIFDLKCDYKSLSKEERQKRDMENLPKKRSINSSDSTPKRDIDKEMSGDSRPLRPGDPGWVARARVPMPSNKDYVVRPRSKVESAPGEAAPPRKVGRFEKHIRKIKDSKGKVKFQKAVGMSLEGRKMAL